MSDTDSRQPAQGVSGRTSHNAPENQLQPLPSSSSPERTFTEDEFRSVIDRLTRPGDAHGARYSAEEIADAAGELGADPTAVEKAIASVVVDAIVKPWQHPGSIAPPRKGISISRQLAGTVIGLSIPLAALSFVAPFLAPDMTLPWDAALSLFFRVLISPAIKALSLVGIVIGGILFMFRDD